MISEVGTSCGCVGQGPGLLCEPPAAVHAGAAVDLQGPVVEEAALLAAPMLGVRDRLAALLGEWPGHPILAQLTAICDRLLGERCTASEHSVASGNMCSLHAAEGPPVATSHHCGTPGRCH